MSHNNLYRPGSILIMLIMLFMVVDCRASPGHVIRCVVGSSLRFIVWVSLANVAAAATGRTKGFWAAKVGPGCHTPCQCNMVPTSQQCTMLR